MKRIFFILSVGLLVFSCGSKKAQNQSSSRKKASPELVYKKAFHEAMRLKLTGKYADAEKVFEQCLALNPNDDGVNFALSELSSYKKDIESAIQFGEKASEINKTNKWYLLNLALLYQKKKDYAKASEAYEKALKGNEDNVNLWFAYSDALIYSENYDKALEAYQKIEDKMGVIPEISMRKHQIYIQQEKLQKAEEEIKNLIATNAKDPNFHGMLADFYMNQKEYGKAKAVLDKMLEMDPSNGRTHLSLTDYYSQQGILNGVQLHLLKAFKSQDLELETKMRIILDNYNRIGKPGDLGKDYSFKLLDALVETHPNEAKVYAVYADYHQEFKNVRGARDMYLKALSRDNSKYPIWNEVLMLSANLNEYDTVYKKGKEALELFPSQPMVYLLAGLGAIEQKKGEEAVEILSAGKNYLLEEKNLKAEFNFQLGRAHYLDKNYDEAFKSYEKAIKIDSLNPTFLNNYAYQLALQKRDLNKALSLVQKAMDMIPENPTYEDTYGWVLFQMGRYSDCLQWLNSAIERAPSSPDLTEHFGDASYKVNDFTGALEYWKKAKELGSKSKSLDKKIKTGKYHE